MGYFQTQSFAFEMSTHEQNANRRALHKRNRGGHRIWIARSCRPRKALPPGSSWWNAGEQADFDAWRQVQAMSAATAAAAAAAATTTTASLGPMPHSKDIGYIPADTVDLFYGDRPHEDESPSPLSPKMTNSFVRPMPVSRFAWHVEPRRRREVKSLPRRWSFGSSTTSSPTSNEKTVQLSLSFSLYLSIYLSLEWGGIELPPLGISMLVERPASRQWVND